MAEGGARLLAVLAAAAAVAVAIAVIWILLFRDGEPAPVASFSFENVPVDAASLEVAMDQVRGELRGGYMEWACLLRCLEPDGCHADIVLTVHYRSAGDARQIVFSGTVDLASGARARLGGVQRPPQPVGGVDRVEIAVDRSFRSGDPEPTPEY
jgi:hypothetical protein